MFRDYVNVALHNILSITEMQYLIKIVYNVKPVSHSSKTPHSAQTKQPHLCFKARCKCLCLIVADFSIVFSALYQSSIFIFLLHFSFTSISMRIIEEIIFIV